MRDLERDLPTLLRTGATDRLARAHDASHFLLTPAAVAVPRDVQELGKLLRASARHAVPMSFRSGGTSLSGQASTDGILVDSRTHFRDITVLDDGARVRAQSGATLRAVNARLARYGRKLGPDPASEIACTIGGVVANNSSGMACGVARNSYHTVDSMVLVLADGTVIDTSVPDADEQLQQKAPAIHDGLLSLRQHILELPDARASIDRHYAIKNTMGYGLNSFVDFERPIDILLHLMVGSEGTLAFVAETTFRTVPLYSHCASGLLLFPSLADAVASLPALTSAGLAAIELLDSTSLRVAQRDPGATAALRTLKVEHQAALLIEHQEADALALQGAMETSDAVLRDLPLETATSLTTNSAERARLWQIRKGLYATVAGNRPTGTTALLEDIAVPADRLLDTCSSLIDLFEEHGYQDSVIFGHAKDGNLHFMVNEDFRDPKQLQRYAAFTEDMVDLVLSRQGTLKAEHGTGRIMAPYLERQYGHELVEIMRSTKQLFDPRNQLNPGVLINSSPQAHLEHLKISEPVEPEVDACVECGYCEPACPSADLTLTPRQRIVLRREIAVAKRAGNAALAEELLRDYAYQGIATCAVDGLCGSACPLHINTADLVRHLRAEEANPLVQHVWKAAASRWSTTTALVGSALSVARRLPYLAAGTTGLARRFVSKDVVPSWTADLPRGGAPRSAIDQPNSTIVYFSSCTASMFGPAALGGGVTKAFLDLCRRADITVRIPDSIGDLCCGVPWKSKGLNDGYAVMQERVAAALWAATNQGQLPVVCDASSCTEGLQVLLTTEQASAGQLAIIDATQFVCDNVLPKLGDLRRLPSLAVHLTCSSQHLGSNQAVLDIAGRIADQVIVPQDTGCCAFAGDRGMLHPELTAAATQREAAEVLAANAIAFASSNRTCELGMTRATGRTYRHILELLHESVGG